MPDLTSETRASPKLRDPIPDQFLNNTLPAAPRPPETILEDILAKLPVLGSKEIEALISIAQHSSDTRVADKAFAALTVAGEKLTPYLGQITELALRGYLEENDRWGPGAWSTAKRLIVAAATTHGREHLCENLGSYNERELHLVLTAIKESGPLDRGTEFRIKSFIAKTEVAQTGLRFSETELRAVELLSFLISIDLKDISGPALTLHAPYDPEHPLRETPEEIKATLSKFVDNAVLLIARGLERSEFHFVTTHLNKVFCAQAPHVQHAFPALKEAVLKERFLQPMPRGTSEAISILTKLKAKDVLLDCLLPESDPRLRLAESDPGYYRDVQIELLKALETLGIKPESRAGWLKSFLGIFSSKGTVNSNAQDRTVG